MLTLSLKTTIMKKNILGAIVIFFVTMAFLLMLDDVSKSKNPEYQDKVKVYDENQQPDLVITNNKE